MGTDYCNTANTYYYDQGLGSPTDPITTGEAENDETSFSLDASGFTESDIEEYISYFADGQEGGSQIHEPCSPSQKQPLGVEHHEEEPARDEDIGLAGDDCMPDCMPSTLPGPAFPKDKRSCDQSRTKNEPSTSKGRRGRSGEGIIREKIPPLPKKRPGKKHEHGKRFRGNNWDHKEVASLLKLKLSASNSVNRTTDWTLISRKLEEDYSITRSAKECAEQWGTARKRFDKLKKELESSNIDEGTFWENRKDKTFNLECYEMVLIILSIGAEIDRVKKQKVHGPQASPASTSRAPRASTTSTSEIMGNSEGHGNEQRPGSSTQLDNPTDGLVRLLAGGDQDRTNKQMVDVQKENIKLDEIQMLRTQVTLIGIEHKSKERECELKQKELDSKVIELWSIKLKLDKKKKELESKMQELQVEL